MTDAIAEICDAQAKIAWAWQTSDWSESLRRWGEIATDYPNLPDGYVGCARALRHLGRIDEAEAVIQPPLRMFSSALSVLAEYAWIGNRLGPWEETLRRWAVVRRYHKGESVGYLGPAVAAREAGTLRLAEAEALLEDAVRRFPDDWGISLNWANVVYQRQDLTEAVRRWHIVCDRFDDLPSAHEGLITALSLAKLPAEAESVGMAACQRFPTHTGLRIAMALASERGGNHAQAIAQWMSICEAEPNLPAASGGLAAALRGAGQLDRAENVLKAALLRFRGDLELERQLAETLSARRDWRRALPLWEALKQRAPRHDVIRDAIRDAVWQARLDQGSAAGQATFVIPDLLLAEDADPEDRRRAMRALLMRFESLGNNCEFGILQRQFRADPLGLMRWASIRPENLSRLLHGRLEGIGDAAQTQVRVINGEYMAIDTRYEISSHTFTMETHVEAGKFFAQHCSRAKFLRRTLIENLETAGKIFVYKFDPLPNDVIFALHENIRAYNPSCSLLCVRLASQDEPSGGLCVLRHGLMVGSIDRFSNTDLSVGAWLSVCQSAAETVHRNFT